MYGLLTVRPLSCAAQCGNVTDQIAVVVTGSPANTACQFLAAGPSFGPNNVTSGACDVYPFGKDCDAYLGSLYLQIGAQGFTTTAPNVQGSLDGLGLGGLRRIGFLQLQVLAQTMALLPKVPHTGTCIGTPLLSLVQPGCPP